MDHSAVFERHRDRLFGLAYRMTGSVADAEDAMQEAWLRWQGVDHDEVRNAEAYLVSVVTRLTIDRLRSAAVRREQYVGPWLPEPLVEGPLGATLPESVTELGDSLTFAFLVLLDELSPAERAAFLLREVFGYGYEEIAAATQRSEDSCRQLVSRARRKLDGDRVELRRPDPDHEQRMVAAMVAAVMTADVDGLLRLLAPDVVLLSDGGPHRHAARRPVVGPDRVARLCIFLGRKLHPDTASEFVRVNGAPGLLARIHGRPDNLLQIGFGPDGRIRRIYSQLNPTKLAHLPPEPLNPT